MKILIFTEGTTIMPSIAQGVSREERVRQSEEGVAEVKNFRTYVPSDNAIQKLNNWKNQGAEIYYLTSRTSPKEIHDVQFVLKKYNFPDIDNLLFRKENQEYKNVAEELMPDVLIEDDCESIGGEVEMTYPHIKSELQNKIKSVVVKEFAGLQNLPDNINELSF